MMKPISMPVKFYVGPDEFEVTNTLLCKNGEVIEEGKMFIFNLLLGQPAWVICIQNDYCPPTYIKTQKVTSVLPTFEVFEGESHPQKYVFEIQVVAEGKKHHVKILAVDELHAKHLCLLARKGQKIEIASVVKGDYSYAL